MSLLQQRNASVRGCGVATISRVQVKAFVGANCLSCKDDMLRKIRHHGIAPHVQAFIGMCKHLRHLMQDPRRHAAVRVTDGLSAAATCIEEFNWLARHVALTCVDTGTFTMVSVFCRSK